MHEPKWAPRPQNMNEIERVQGGREITAGPWETSKSGEADVFKVGLPCHPE